MISNIEFLVETLKHATQEVATQRKLVETLVDDAKFIQQQRDAAQSDRTEFLEQRNELQARNEDLLRQMEVIREGARCEFDSFRKERDELQAEIVMLRGEVTKNAKSLELFQLLGEPGERIFYTIGALLYSTEAKDNEVLYILDGSTFRWTVSSFETLSNIRSQLGATELLSYENAIVRVRTWLASMRKS